MDSIPVTFNSATPTGNKLNSAEYFNDSPILKGTSPAMVREKSRINIFKISSMFK